MNYRTIAFLAGVLLASTPALAEGWKIVGAGNGHGETMSLEIDSERSYIFECAPDAIVITYTGVTDLLDIRGNGKVGDAPGSVMPEGAAMMALFTRPRGKLTQTFGPYSLVSLRAAAADNMISGVKRGP